MTAFQVVKALLRGKFSEVSEFRKKHRIEFYSLPTDVQNVAVRFLTPPARGDATGRAILKSWLEKNSQLCPKS